MADFTRIESEHVATCPSCEQWLWRVGPSSGFYGGNEIERPMKYMASDGDTLPFGEDLPFPLEAYTEFDAELLKGECPHCNEGYWFVLVAYPEIPISNTGLESEVAFICDPGRIEIGDHVDGAFIGDPSVAQRWVQMRERARWGGRDIYVDVHLVGPFPGGDILVGPAGVGSCSIGSGGEDQRDIWADAVALVRAITPPAIASLRDRANAP